MRYSITIGIILLLYIHLSSQITDSRATEVWEPEPRTISYDALGIPSDAIILLGKSSMNQWQNGNG